MVQVLGAGTRRKLHIEPILVVRSGKQMNHVGLFESTKHGRGLRCKFRLNDTMHYPSQRDGSEVDIDLLEQLSSVQKIPHANAAPRMALEACNGVAFVVARGLRDARELIVEIMNDNLEHVESCAMAPGGPWPIIWMEGRNAAFFPPRVCRDENDLPYYMLANMLDDHRKVSCETAVRTIARREDQFTHIVRIAL